MSEKDRFTATLKALAGIRDLGQAIVTEAFEKDGDVPRYQVMALCDIANMALLKYDPSRQEELEELRKWGMKEAHDLGLETLAEEVREQEATVDRETLAAVQHDIWSHWMTYLFAMCNPNEDGTYTIPEGLARRWMRQMAIPYACLAEHEKQSDRDQADKVIAAIRALALDEEASDE